MAFLNFGSFTKSAIDFLVLLNSSFLMNFGLLLLEQKLCLFLLRVLWSCRVGLLA